MLYELLYFSVAPTAMTPDDLAVLINQCRQDNPALEITGILLYHKREFMQLLEGEKETVLALFDKIKQDTRHTHAHVLWEGPIEQRGFASWTIAFKDVADLPDDFVEQYLSTGFSAFEQEGSLSMAQALFRNVHGYL